MWVPPQSKFHQFHHTIGPIIIPFEPLKIPWLIDLEKKTLLNWAHRTLPANFHSPQEVLSGDVFRRCTRSFWSFSESLDAGDIDGGVPYIDGFGPENGEKTPKRTQSGFADHEIPMNNGYFIGGIPYFQTYRK